MITEIGRTKGEVTVDEEYMLLGIIDGSVTVQANGRFQLMGTVTGSLTVEAGGTALVLGLVEGDVTNDGGDLTVAGRVNGKLDGKAGQTRMDERSRVQGGVTGTVEAVKLVR